MKSMPKPQLNTVTLDFIASAAGTYVVNIPKALSLYNRKSFRQGYVYSVDYIEYIGSAGDIVTIGKLPETYVTLQAYQMGFKLWKEQRAIALGESSGAPGKWSDFKPYYNQAHMNSGGAGGWTELWPKGLEGNLILQDLDNTNVEWNYADIVVNDYGAGTTSTHQVGMLGADDVANNYVSLIEAYGDTRLATLAPDPLLPTTASGSWIMFTGEQAAEMTSDVMDLVEDENDNPPYANQNNVTLPATYVGNSQCAESGLLVDQSHVGTTGRPVVLSGGLFPLGYLAINNAGGGYTLRVHCTRGDYKGAVAALPMGDFN